MPTNKIILNSYDQIPNLSPLLRTVNIVLVLIVIFLMYYLNMAAFFFGVLTSSAIMPIVLCLALTAGMISGFLTLAGNGRRIEYLCVISSLMSLVVAMILFNTQIYLYTLAICILSLETTLELLNGFHIWAAIIIVLLFVSSYLTMLAAVQIKNRNLWLKKNVCVWPNDKPLYMLNGGHVGEHPPYPGAYQPPPGAIQPSPGLQPYGAYPPAYPGGQPQQRM